MVTLTSAHAGFVLSLILQVSPPSRVTAMQARRESPEAIEDRLKETANDIANVVWLSNEEPLFGGRHGRRLTAALIVTTAVEESGFRSEVDDGTARGDNGQSWCLGQIKLSGMRIKFEDNGFYSYSFDSRGYSGRDLVTDRSNCIKAIQRILRTSQDYCRHLRSTENRFAAYASGKCSIGQDISRRRVQKAHAIVQEALGVSIEKPFAGLAQR